MDNRLTKRLTKRLTLITPLALRFILGFGCGRDFALRVDFWDVLTTTGYPADHRVCAYLWKSSYTTSGVWCVCPSLIALAFPFVPFRASFHFGVFSPLGLRPSYSLLVVGLTSAEALLLLFRHAWIFLLPCSLFCFLHSHCATSFFPARSAILLFFCSILSFGTPYGFVFPNRRAWGKLIHRGVVMSPPPSLDHLWTRFMGLDWTAYTRRRSGDSDVASFCFVRLHLVSNLSLNHRSTFCMLYSLFDIFFPLFILLIFFFLRVYRCF